MDRREMALECLEVERCGGNVQDFLRELGAISPWGTWWRLQVEELGRERHQIRDGKENNMGKKAILTPEVRAEAEKMIEAGQDRKQIEAYLAEHESKNPNAHVYVIKKSMEKKQAEELDSGHPEIKTLNGKEFERMEKPSPTCCQPARPSGVTVPDQLPEEKPKPKIRIREADGAIGTWRRQLAGEISFKMPADHLGEDDQEITLGAEEWMVIAAELPNVLELFGMKKEAGA